MLFVVENRTTKTKQELAKQMEANGELKQKNSAVYIMHNLVSFVNWFMFYLRKYCL